MKRILALAAALTLVVSVGSASAHFGRHHHHHGFVIAGTGASFSGTQASDGTYTGDLTLTLTRHGDHSSRVHASWNSGNEGNTGSGQSVTKTFHLDGTEVKFSKSITDANGDGAIDFSDVQPTDVVALLVGGRHHWSSAHSSCHNSTGSTSDRQSGSGTPTIKKAFVFRPNSAT